MTPKSLVGDANPFYGRVVYGPGLALDQPLSVTRFEYRDNPVSNDALAWPSFTVLPFWDYRGVPVFGLFSDGAYRKPYDATGHTQCPDSPGTGTTDRCVYLTWPFAGSVYHQDRGLVQTFSWQGSLLQKKRDVSGLTYARNRMYDPQTGRFTQEDPIGLAGGLNAYGFADGDPVNASDPFGLATNIDNLAPKSDSTKERIGQPSPSPFGEPALGPYQKLRSIHYGAMIIARGVDPAPSYAMQVSIAGKPGVRTVLRLELRTSRPASFGRTEYIYSGSVMIDGQFYEAQANLYQISGLLYGFVDARRP